MIGNINDIIVTVEAPMNESMGPKLGNSSASPITVNSTPDLTKILFNPNSKNITKILI